MSLREAYGHPSHRPLVEAIAKRGGLLGKEPSPVGDDGHMDVHELVAQRAMRELASHIIGDMGWRFVVEPPLQTKPAQPGQSVAEVE